MYNAIIKSDTNLSDQVPKTDLIISYLKRGSGPQEMDISHIYLATQRK